MPTLEERVDTLESLLGQFIIHTDVALRRLEAEMKVLKDEMIEFKNEMAEFKNEMREFKNEMAEFKNEMLAYKNQSLEERKMAYRQWGELANKMGTIVEDMVIPNISGIAKKYFGCKEFDFFASRIKKKNSKDRSKHREFDVIAIFDDKVIVNETKSTPRITYIDDFCAVLKEFYDYFPEYKGKEIIPIFSSLYLSDDVISYLTKNKIYAMAIKEETMDILNFEEVSNRR